MKGPQPFQTQIYFLVTLFRSFVRLLKMLHMGNTICSVLHQIWCCTETSVLQSGNHAEKNIQPEVLCWSFFSRESMFKKINNCLTISAVLKVFPASFSAQSDVLVRGHAHVPRLFQRHQFSAAARKEGSQYGVRGIPVPYLEPQRPAPVQLLGRWNVGIGSKRWESHSAH